MQETSKTISAAGQQPIFSKSAATLPAISTQAQLDSKFFVWRLWKPYMVSVLLLVGAFGVTQFDAWLAHPDRVHQLPGDLLRLFYLTEFFAHGFGVIILAVGIFMLAPAAKLYTPRIMACALWPGLVAHFLKIQFGRLRPIRFFDKYSVSHFPEDPGKTWLGWFHNDQWNYEYVNQSFPSAHTATVWGLAIGMTWAFPRGRWLFFAIAVMASAQRVISYAHWPSDVLFGAAVAFCCAGALTQNWGAGWVLGKFESRMAAKVRE
jgi:membrane-associated phospholipid phosphatase